MALPERIFFSHSDEFEAFEDFFTALLNSGVKLPFQAIPSNLIGGESVAAARYGKKGDDQRGVDIVSLLPNGDQVVFQCKYRTQQANRRFGKTEATRAINLASEKYPDAIQYVLVTNHEFTTGATDVLLKAGWWPCAAKEFLGLVNTLPREQGYHLIHQHFGEDLSSKIFPGGPNLLLSPAEYRKTFDASPLAHRYQCLGRDAEIQALHKELTSTKPRAVLLVGEGGVGKSRVFCEALERLDNNQDPNTLVRILQPGLPDASAQQISRKETKQIILGMDECHLPGYFREDIVVTLKKSSPNSRLLLVTRPEAAPNLRDSLRRLGWDVADEAYSLCPLGKEDMYNLAKEVVGRGGDDVRQLSQASDGKALITIIGGHLLKESGGDLAAVVTNKKFQRGVYQALEDQFLRTISSDRKATSRKALRLLACVSPWNTAQEGIIIEMLGILGSEFEQIKSDLENAGLIKPQGDLIRVIPDLLSDHLVFEALAGPKKDSKILSALKNTDFLIKHGPAMIRNLAMARWRGKYKASYLDPLLEQLIEYSWNRFVLAHDQERLEILSLWENWAVGAASGVLRLSRLALESAPNPPQSINSSWSTSEQLSNYRGRLVQTTALKLIGQIIVYCEAEQAAALNLLWSHRDKLPERQNSTTVESAYRSFNPEPRRSEKSWIQSLQWLEERLTTSPEDPWFIERSSQLRDFLFPALNPFRRETQSYGRSIQLSAKPINPDFANAGRSLALRIIEQVAMTSEVGALNCIGILREIAWSPRLPYGGNLPPEWLKKWEPTRHRALEILGNIQRKRPEMMVQFRLRQTLKDLSNLNHQTSEFLSRCSGILESIDDSDQMCFYLALLSHDWQEFKATRKEKESISQWDSVCRRAASHLLELSQSEELPQLCDRLGSEFSKYGASVGWGYLFEKISESKERILELLSHLISNPEVAYKSSFEFLSHLSGEKDSWLAQGIGTKDPDLLGVATFALSRNEETDYPLTREALLKLCQNADEQIVTLLFSHGLVSLFHESEVNGLILKSIPWTSVTIEHLEELDKGCDNYEGRFEMPPEAFPYFFQRLEDLPAEAIHQVSNLIQQGIQKAPQITFDFFNKRVLSASDESENVIPYDFDGSLSFPSSDQEMNTRELAEQALETFLENPQNKLQRKWFRIAYLSSHPDLLVGKIPGASLLNFRAIVNLVKGSRKFLCLNQPALVDAILKETEERFPDRLEEHSSALTHSLFMRGRSYENGIPTNNYVLETARKLSSKYAATDRLRRFYDRIVKDELDHIEVSQKRYEEENREEDKF